MDSNERKVDLYRLARQRNRDGKDVQHVPVIRIIRLEKSLKADKTCSETLQESTKLKAALDKREKSLEGQRKEWEKEKN